VCVCVYIYIYIYFFFVNCVLGFMVSLEEGSSLLPKHSVVC